MTKSLYFLLIFFQIFPFLCQANEEEQPEVYDIMIVGGGVSGTYCAWRLSEKNSEDSLKNIGLMELSDRIGGRLYSVTLPELPDVFAEFGGMRFSDQHQNLIGLVNQLKLKIEPFEMGTDKNILFLRGVRYRRGEFAKKQLSYKLRENERGKTDDELLIMAITHAFPETASLKGEEFKEFLKKAVYKGQPIWQWGFWNFLLSEISEEAYRFIDDCYGYLSEMSNWNAYDAIIDVWEDIHIQRLYKLTNASFG
jgi:hypothetical protein